MAINQPGEDQTTNAALVDADDGAGGTLWNNVQGAINLFKTSWASLAGATGAALVGFSQAGAGAIQRTAQGKLRESSTPADFGAVGDGTADDSTAIANTAAKPAGSATSAFSLLPATNKITSELALTAYNIISGRGDQSQIKQATAAANAIAYTSHAGVFDDHPHNALRDFRVTGDGAFAAYPAAQTGTTTGVNLAVVPSIGNFAQTSGMTFELHSIGKHVKNSYAHTSDWCHYRANKIGLKLEEVTSYTEKNSYFRGNSTAAVQVIGGQNVTIQGGAIEGNAGVGLQYVAGSSTWGQINIDNVYFESNGSEAGGIWSIDVPFGSPTMVNVRGGNLWRNVASGVTSGPYRLGDNATLDGATLNGAIYAKYLRVRNTRGNPTFGTFATEATARLFGLGEPPIMLEYSPAVQEYDFSAATGGIVFGIPVAGKGVAKLPGITNLMSAAYPYGFGASSGAAGAANAGLNYGEGDAFRVTYAASTGNFSSNYATLVNFTDTGKPYRVCCVVVYPEVDCELGFVQSVGGQSINANYALKANTYYKLVLCGMAPMSAGSFLRVFPLNSAAPVVNFIGTWASAHVTHAEQLRVMRALVAGRV